MNKIILIGGAPGAGKSTMASKIASARGVNWISTDQIRTIMKKATNSDSNPDLFLEANAAETAEESVALEIRKAEAVWKGVAEFIENINPWEGCVIEGSAILPHLVARDLKDSQDVLPIFVIQSEELVKQVIAERSKNPWINTKTPEQQKKKVEQTMLLINFIKDEAVNNGFALHVFNSFTDGNEELFSQATKF